MNGYSGSQNIVGFINVPATSTGAYYLLTCQFSIGANNGLNEIFNSPLPDYSEVLIWNGSGYDVYYADSTSSSGWDDAGLSPLASAPSVDVAEGFFMIPSGAYTWTVGL